MEFRVILDYLINSRAAWASGGDPVSKQANTEVAMKVREDLRGAVNLALPPVLRLLYQLVAREGAGQGL